MRFSVLITLAIRQGVEKPAQMCSLIRAFAAHIQINTFKYNVCNKKLIFLFLNQNICCGYSEERSQ